MKKLKIFRGIENLSYFLSFTDAAKRALDNDAKRSNVSRFWLQPYLSNNLFIIPMPLDIDTYTHLNAEDICCFYTDNFIIYCIKHQSKRLTKYSKIEIDFVNNDYIFREIE